MARYYAGIGSRKTPSNMLRLMTLIATDLREQGFILRSGGAQGADSAFEVGAGDTQPQIIVVSARKSGIKAPPGYSVVRVDRTTPLGNPFYMKDESERGKVCWQYEVYFLPALRHNRAMRKFFFALLDRARAGEKLALECWCAPRACHADTIKRYLDQAILKRQTRT